MSSIEIANENVDFDFVKYEIFFIFLILLNFCNLYLRFEQTSIVV